MSRRRKRNKKNISKNVKQAYNTNKSRHITSEEAINDIFKKIGATDEDCKPIPNDVCYCRDYSDIDEGSEKEINNSEKGRRLVYNLLHGDLDLHFEPTEQIIKDGLEVHLSLFMRKIYPFQHMKAINVEVEEIDDKFAFTFTVNITGELIGFTGFCDKKGKLLGTNKETLESVLENIEKKAKECYEKNKHLLGAELPANHPRAIYLGTNYRRALRKLYFNVLTDKELPSPMMTDEQVEYAIFKTIHSIVDKGYIDPNKEGAKEYLKRIIDEL